MAVFMPGRVRVPSLLPPIGPALEDFTWADISKIAKSGNAAAYWNIGDIKSISFNGETYYVQIIGFDHDDVTDSAAYGRSKAGITFQFGVANDSSKAGAYAASYTMNSSNTNSGGWTSCVTRTSTMATMKGYMPAELQGVLVAVNKLTSAGSQSTTINTTSDELWLLSEIEIFGSTAHSVSGEGSQYAFYSAGNSKVRYKNGYTSYWWERSPFASDSNSFCVVYSDGTATYNSATGSFGVSFGFCV